MKKRNTKQQQKLIEVVENIENFFTAEELNETLENDKIGLATIYRFLNKLEKEKKLYSYICDRRKVYSKEEKSHCHFVCEKSGKIIHFTIDNIDFLKDKIPGKISSFQLEVRGVCDSCQIENKNK